MKIKIMTMVIALVLCCSIMNCTADLTPSCSDTSVKTKIIDKIRVYMGNDIYKQNLVDANIFDPSFFMTYEQALKIDTFNNPKTIDVINQTTEEVNRVKLTVVNIRTDNIDKEAKATECRCQVYIDDKPINKDIRYTLQKTSDGNTMITIH